MYVSQLVTENNRSKTWSQVTKIVNRSFKGVIRCGLKKLIKNFETRELIKICEISNGNLKNQLEEEMFNEEELIIIDKRMEIIGKAYNGEKYKICAKEMIRIIYFIQMRQLKMIKVG